MARLSIIVPAYNAEKYIRQTLDSLKNQTMKEIEVICVNDGSKDNTLKIMKEYAENDSRFIIVDKQNEGIGLARRDGIINSTSKYISFLDSDDYYEETFCEKMYLLMENNKLDLIECGYRIFFENNKVKEHYYLEKHYFYNKEEFLKNIFCSTIINGDEAVVVWNKVYKKDIIIKTVNYYGNNILEDYVFNMQYYTMVNKYYFFHETLMNYRVTNNSISKTFNREAYDVLKKIQLLKAAIMKNMKFETKYFKDAANWYCKYTKNYLLVNRVYFRDKKLFIRIINDVVLKKQSKTSRKKDWFSITVNNDYTLLMITCMHFFMILQCIKRIIKTFSE